MTTPPIVAPKKLIEVALPLDEINKASAREKSIRHGHPSTLHLWWARRPLAAARAVLFAQLVNDPSWKYSDEELKKNQIKGSITKRRNELFKLITELVQWENTTNEDVLERARKEIRASWKETCEANKNHPDAKTLFDPNKLPAFHDPFAGGGSIPLEAQRLGLEAHASDLNPVAVLINKAMIEIPPKFAGRAPVGPVPKGEKQTKAKAVEDWSGARGLAEDVRRYGAWMREEAEKRIGHLYPKVEITKEMAKERPDLKPLLGRKLTAIAWLWARTIVCPNPACAAQTPTLTSFVLAQKPGKERYLRVASKNKVPVISVVLTPSCDSPEEGLKRGTSGVFECVHCKTVTSREYVAEQGAAGRIGQIPTAVVAAGNRERIYLAASWLPPPSKVQLPDTVGLDVPLAPNPRDVWCRNFGLTTVGNLFTHRQLATINALCELVHEAGAICRKDATPAGLADDTSLEAGGHGARAYAEAVVVYLAIAVARYSNASSTLCTWNPGATKEDIRFTFSRQALPMTWDFSEGNPFSESSGNFGDNIETWIYKAICRFPAGRQGFSLQENAINSIGLSLPAVSTDPPYYDNIGYADLSDFFYAPLRKMLRGLFRDLFATLAVPKSDELVAAAYRHGGRTEAENFFLEGMTRVLQRLRTEVHPGLPLTIYYAFKQSDTSSEEGTSSTGWETFLQAMLTAGLGITGTWPMRTERGGRSIGIGTNALASSIILACRPRPDSEATVPRKDFLRQLERVLPNALTEMIADPEAAVAPVDLAQAAIGPGMAIFSKYKAVLEADGAPMTVHSALVHINKAVDEFFAEAEGDLDADTRFCIDWFQQRGFEPGPFGEADVLARAKGTAVNGVEEAGVLSAAKGKVRLLRIKEYPKKWDPTKDARVPVWEACHQMCRALGESESEAGALLARMPEKQDAIRQLAYRLYTICERQKWAEEARAYNELITSWPAIVDESRKVGHKGTQLDLM